MKLLCIYIMYNTVRTAMYCFHRQDLAFRQDVKGVHAMHMFSG